MPWPLMLAALVTGALVPLQLAFNGQLGGVTRNAFTASLIVFLIGSVVLTLIVLITRPALPSMGTLTSASPTVWLVGQIMTALALDHFGAFGNPQHTLDPGRLAGLALMVCGIVVIKAF